MKLIFLYTRLPSYMVACIKKLLMKNPGYEVHLVQYPVSTSAPFEFSRIENLFLYNRNEYTAKGLTKLVRGICPSAIFCSGWSDKDYVKICNSYSNKIPTILSMDNQWENRLKQYIACVLSRVFLLPSFSHIWVPGKPQALYAKYLGFKKHQIYTGCYSADTDFYDMAYQECYDHKDKVFPKKFLYVGRYSEEKGLKDLWEVFKSIQEKDPSQWELWCIGTGPLFEKRMLHPQIFHLGFCQPAKLSQYIREAGVFILPSHREPWGVVIHEFAVAGFPIVSSDVVGANSDYLVNGTNGYTYAAGNRKSLKTTLINIMGLPDDVLAGMGRSSHIQGLKYTSDTWADRIKEIISN